MDKDVILVLMGAHLKLRTKKESQQPISFPSGKWRFYTPSLAWHFSCKWGLEKMVNIGKKRKKKHQFSSFTPKWKYFKTWNENLAPWTNNKHFYLVILTWGMYMMQLNSMLLFILFFTVSKFNTNLCEIDRKITFGQVWIESKDIYSSLV